MKKLLVVSCFLFLVAAGIQAAEVNVTGKWEITTTTQRGERTAPIEFTQSGQELKVTMQSRQGDSIEASGKVVGEQIEWTVTRQTQRGELTMTYTGKVSGDTMSGDVQFGSMGSGTWTAKKQSD